ncbi:MAG: hypothetical protein ACD_52C00290G0003 [uncultured bacterium]|nr:MAG: hypothetical protein ACD_52C00290G0003 [uncultured bacterium]
MPEEKTDIPVATEFEVYSLPTYSEPEEVDIVREVNPAFDPPEFEIRGEQYTNQGEIAHGAVSFVYLVEGSLMGKRLVAKMAKPNEREERLGVTWGLQRDNNRLVERQARALQVIEQYQRSHGVVVDGRLLIPEVIDTGTVLVEGGERAYVAMVFEQGIPIKEISTPLPLEDVVNLGSQFAGLLESIVESGYLPDDYVGRVTKNENGEIACAVPKDAIYDPLTRRIVMFDVTLGRPLPEQLLFDEEAGDPRRNPAYFEPVQRAIYSFALFINGLMMEKGGDLEQYELAREYYRQTEGGERLVAILEKALSEGYSYASDFAIDMRELWRSMQRQSVA